MKPTCLDYALDQLYAEGGYLVAGLSIHWPMAHAMHTREAPADVTHYAPHDPLGQSWHSVLGFDGAVVSGDPDPRGPFSRRAVVLSFAVALALSIRWAVWHWWRAR